MEQDFLEMSPENQYRELWAEYMGPPGQRGIVAVDGAGGLF